MTLTRESVDAWRRAQEKRVAEGLGALDQRLRQRLAHDLETFHDSVADLLGVSLTLPQDGGRLTPNPWFRYHFSEDVGQTELLAGWIRRNLPGTAGRERARAHLTGEAGSLVPMQVGRVRADLQERLTESTHHMVRAIAARHEAVARRLSSALEQSQQEETVTDQTVVLAERERVLRQILVELAAEDARESRTRDVSSESSGKGP
ncbi:hypothetical protein ACFYM5_23580 [Streptomyces sp. NPDC006706]|uniref:hypothetical protein n=1 Tax=Streptomyces sp. NPDC006706 TaxID=3364761 RepID=UPI0036C025EC